MITGKKCLTVSGLLFCSSMVILSNQYDACVRAAKNSDRARAVRARAKCSLAGLQPSKTAFLKRLKNGNCARNARKGLRPDSRATVWQVQAQCITIFE